MPEALILVVFYVGITFFIVLLGIVRYADAGFAYDRKWAARMVFGAPLWPFIAVRWVFRAVRDMWQAADLKVRR
jgi:hypothetical protein